MKVTEGRVSAARLDRFYVNKTCNNRLTAAIISPVGVSYHHLVTVHFSLMVHPQRSPYWHFNIRLMYDETFCQSFSDFWGQWRHRKTGFENVGQWWEVGKTQIRIFCQQYTSHTRATEMDHFELLEKEISLLEEGIINGLENNNATWEKKEGSFK